MKMDVWKTLTIWWKGCCRDPKFHWSNLGDVNELAGVLGAYNLEPNLVRLMDKILHPLQVPVMFTGGTP